MNKTLIEKLLLLLLKEENEVTNTVELSTITNSNSKFIGQMVISRSSNAGNIYGELVEVKEKSIVLKNARRLWYWKCKKGFTLEDIANHGIDSDSKVTSPVSLLEIIEDAILILPVTKEAQKTIDAQSDYQP